MNDSATEVKTTSSTVAAGAGQRRAVLLIGLDDAEGSTLEAMLPEGVQPEARSVEEFCAKGSQTLAATALGCFVKWDKDSPVLSAIREYHLLWHLHGIGLCLVGSGAAPHVAALAEELGVEDWIQAEAADQQKGRRLVERWMRREKRHGNTVLRLMQEIEACLVTSDYEKTRQLIDSLVMLDPRKRFYLGLLALQMREAKQFDKVEDCLRRALIHWPRHAKALAGLCEHFTVQKDLTVAATFGKQVIESFGLTFVDAIIGSGTDADGDAFLAGAPQTRRLMAQLYGSESVVNFAKSYANSLEPVQDSDDLDVVAAILQQAGNADVLAGLPDLCPQTPSLPQPANESGQPPEAGPDQPAPVPEGAAIGSEAIVHAPLDAAPPDRALTNSKLIEAVSAAAKDEPDYVAKNSGGGIDIVYKGRVFIFHLEVGGYKRLAKVFGSIGCEITEGQHDAGLVLDRLHSVKVDVLVLWYQEGQEQALDLLRHIAESRDLYRVPVWVLTPSQTVQIQFATKAQGLLFDGNDVVRWQRPQLDADFKRLLERAKAPDSIMANVTRLRRTWSEPMTAPLSQEQHSKTQAALVDSLAKQPGRLYWLKAEEALQAAARGDAQTVLAVATKLRDGQPEMFDPRFVLATVKAALGEAEVAASELLEWVLNKKVVTPERSLIMARAFTKWKATGALQGLANAVLQDDKTKSSHQAQAVAALYYGLGKSTREASAHLAEALFVEPSRLDYLIDLAGSLDRRDASRAADLWELVARQNIVPKWFCLLQGAETLIRAENFVRAAYMLEASAKENPGSKEVQTRLAEIQKSDSRISKTA